MKQAASAVEKAKANPALGSNSVATRPASKPSGGGAVAHRPAPGALTVPDTDIDFAADAGDGMQHVDADSIAIPFLAVLQKTSPQCDPDANEYDPEAKPGMIMNTVTKELFDVRSEPLLIVPCNYTRKFLRWAPREAGGGFKGEFRPEEVVKLREQGQIVEQDVRLYFPDEDGSVNPKKNDKVADTRVHYVLHLNQRTGVAEQAVLSLASTQIKKSKQLNSLLSGVVIAKSDGSTVHPATYASVVALTTVPESNDKGSWAGVAFSLHGLNVDPAIYATARSFSKLVEAGRATVNFDAAASAMGDVDTVEGDARDMDRGESSDARPARGGAGRNRESGF